MMKLSDDLALMVSPRMQGIGVKCSELLSLHIVDNTRRCREVQCLPLFQLPLAFLYIVP